MTTKRKGESVRQKLASLSAKQKVKYTHIETTFLIERLVARFVSDKTLSKHLVFKGGFVGLKVYNSPRYTIDLDALLLKANVDATLTQTQKAAESDLDDGVWFRFQEQVDLATQGEYGGVRQVYRAGIGEMLKNLKKAQVINFDLGIGDPITPGPQNMVTNSLMQKDDELSWSVYPIETIIAEKLHALISHGDENSRSKDVHDLAIFLPKAEPMILRDAIKNCFNYRSTQIPISLSGIIKNIKTVRLERGWSSAVSSIERPKSFDSMFSSLIETLITIEEKWI